jgi:hypothetical protein
MVDNSIHTVTIGCMPFIQFPFIEVPKELLPIVGSHRASEFGTGGAQMG